MPKSKRLAATNRRARPSASTAVSPRSPLGRLIAKGGPASELGDSLFFSRALCDQFAQAVADENRETALAMLAGCPQLARMPCRKALHSALHWSCASPAMAPLAEALLRLGADPTGTFPGEAPAREPANTPLRWAASSGSLRAVAALLGAGARPMLGDLREACRSGQGACGLAILDARPDLDPFADLDGQSCHQALSAAVEGMTRGFAEGPRGARALMAAFERRAIEVSAGRARSEQESRTGRL